MKPRHQPIGNGHRSHVPVEDEFGSQDVTFQTRPGASQLRNIQLERTPRGEFLVFETDDGRRFAMNLDCQEEYGFEARTTLQQWAAEQDWH